MNKRIPIGVIEAQRLQDIYNQTNNIKCPFCGETRFDLIGLKIHFLRGWCEKYNELIIKS